MGFFISKRVFLACMKLVNSVMIVVERKMIRVKSVMILLLSIMIHVKIIMILHLSILSRV